MELKEEKEQLKVLVIFCVWVALGFGTLPLNPIGKPTLPRLSTATTIFFFFFFPSCNLHPLLLLPYLQDFILCIPPSWHRFREYPSLAQQSQVIQVIPLTIPFSRVYSKTYNVPRRRKYSRTPFS